MSERSFFDLRYAVPGYTFLLFFILILNEVVLYLLQILTRSTTSETLTGFLVSILTLLSGTTIGFLVSQPWYCFYNCCFKKERYLKDVFTKFKNLGICPNKRICNDQNGELFGAQKKDVLITVIDYIVQKEHEQLKDYIGRRYDLINLMGSTIVSIAMVLVFYVVALFFPMVKFDWWPDVVFIVIALFWLGILYKNLVIIVEENKSMLCLILDLNKNRLKELKDNIQKS